MTRLTVFAFIALATSVAAATPASAPASTTKAVTARPPVLTGRAKRGYAFVREHCARCHGITPNSSSPNPESPPFESIANMPALSELTFTRFLEDSHNYPEAMNFKVDHKRIKDIAAYILTMRGEDFRPPI